MTDRELLELAAKAAGIEINQAMQIERDEAGYAHVGLFTKRKTCWNPLTDDGDALRLAVKLRFEDILYCRNDLNSCNGDIYAATRLAIVKAAAEIGRNM